MSLETENAQMRQELKVLKLKLGRVQASRDQLETELSIIKAENDELQLIVKRLEQKVKFVETPILAAPQLDTPVSEKSFEAEQKNVEPKKEEEPEFYSESGPDFDSRWYKDICIVKSHPDYIVLKNCSPDKHRCLDDYIFFRTVDGKEIVSGTPLPDGVILRPQSEFTIHAYHPGAKEVFGESCILHRHTTFGEGKVTENKILDETGKETANHIICVFKE